MTMLAEPPIDTTPEPRERTPQIYRLMGEVMRKIGHISKERQAQFGDRYSYRGIDDVYQSVGPF